jgi:hypothetical protein
MVSGAKHASDDIEDAELGVFDDECGYFIIAQAACP